MDKKNQMTEDALKTLDYFGWVVLDQVGSVAVIADDICTYRVLVSALNKAALSADARLNITDPWQAHDDWCDSWDGLEEE